MYIKESAHLSRRIRDHIPDFVARPLGICLALVAGLAWRIFEVNEKKIKKKKMQA